METKPIGLYVHIPFCKKKCNYCDFCSVACGSDKITRYTDNLIREIESYKRNPKIKIDTVFFGGGTPSVIDVGSFLKIASAVYDSFDVAADTELSVEVNPATLTDEKLSAFREVGVNRISIGLQSIHENEMKILGRIHTYDDFLKTYHMVRAAGIKNINVDLMYGIPEQSVSSFKKTLDAVIALSPEHVSAYGLIVEEGTPFFTNRDKLNLPDEDTEYSMYLDADRKLFDAGYAHYEISNYAQPGYVCRHNLKYWRDEEYIGVGLAAHSYYLGKRFYNTASFDEYFEDFGAKYRKEENANVGLDKFEYAMLGLRLSEGISLAEYKKLFDESFADGNEEKLDAYIKAGFMQIKDGRLSFTAKGFYISNAIMAELL